MAVATCATAMTARIVTGPNHMLKWYMILFRQLIIPGELYANEKRFRHKIY